MKIYKTLIVGSLLTFSAASSWAQVQVQEGGQVRRRTGRENAPKVNGQVTGRMQSFYEQNTPSDADLVWMREIYRQIDLQKEANTPLYYPEDVIDGQENLFRMVFNLVLNGRIPAYEYLDGREVFTDKYKVKVNEMLDRFGIYYTRGKGSTDANPKFVVEEADVPSGQVKSYYVIEKWEFDKRSNQMKTRIQAICPVLNKIGDFGEETKYPMFWIKFDQLRPFLAQQYVFLSDDNNLPRYSLDDYFTLNMYEGDIIKTRNLRNLSMMQMYPDSDDLKAAQDSIDQRLRNFGADLWVPTREEYLAQREREEAEEDARLANPEGLPERENVAEGEGEQVGQGRATKPKKNVRAKPKKRKKPKVSHSSVGGNNNAERSVRRRKK